ncbi:MAG: CorA family divalent cation transporter [Candidatus Scalindua sp.]
MQIKFHKLNENRYLEPSSVKEFCEYRAHGDPIWVDITQPDKAALEEFFSPIQLHPLILEASLEPSAGSRIAPYEKALFIRIPVQASPNRDEQSFLSIFSTVFMPLFLIAGIYGMNFTYMPELKWHYGYPIVTVVMLIIAGGLLWIFLRRGWFK